MDCCRAGRYRIVWLQDAERHQMRLQLAVKFLYRFALHVAIYPYFRSSIFIIRKKLKKKK
jgi:hypothetical protein